MQSLPVCRNIYGPLAWPHDHMLDPINYLMKMVFYLKVTDETENTTYNTDVHKWMQIF